MLGYRVIETCRVPCVSRELRGKSMAPELGAAHGSGNWSIHASGTMGTCDCGVGGAGGDHFGVGAVVPGALQPPGGDHQPDARGAARAPGSAGADRVAEFQGNRSRCVGAADVPSCEPGGTNGGEPAAGTA